MNNYENTHITSQSHKTQLKDYKINPAQIPRPNSFNEMYQNELNEPVYVTSIDTLPPFSSTFFKVIENENSSCRYIRSSFSRLPLSQKILNQTCLPFSLYFQPFANLLPEEDKKISKFTVNSNDYNDKIYRCSQCKAYLNLKFKTQYKGEKKVLLCNICGTINEVNHNVFNLLESISSPTIEYTIQNDKEKKFVPHFIFLIDISNDISYASYVISSLSSSIESMFNPETKIAFCTFDERGLIYFYVEKSEAKIVIMNDINSPFAPITENKLFIASNAKDEIAKIIEKVNIIIERKKNIEGITSNVVGAAISSCIDTLIDIGGRIVVFSSNPCFKGYASISLPSIKSTNSSSDLYEKQREVIYKMITKCNENKIGIDQYIIINNEQKSNYNLFKSSYEKYISLYSELSNETGGHFTIYPIDYTQINSMTNATYEKIHFDVLTLLSSNNYYGTSFMLRHSQDIVCENIIGIFERKVGEAFQLGVCDSDYSCAYFFRYASSGEVKYQRLDFQIAILFTDSLGDKKMRIINFGLNTTDDVNILYSSCDVDVMSKVTIMKTISSVKVYDDISKIADLLYKRILNSFRFYRNEGAIDRDPNQLVLPSTLKYYPLYLFSFKRKVKLYSLNKVFHMLNLKSKMMRDSLDSCTKWLYPRFYRIDDIELDQTYNAKYVTDKSLIISDIGETNKYGIIQKPYMLRLSIDNIDFDSAYLIDNGDFIDLIIFDCIQYEFYDNIFAKETWSDCVEANISEIVEDDSKKLNVKLRNVIDELRKENGNKVQPLRIIFMNERSISNNILLASYLIEDENGKECNYVDYLCALHRDIQKEVY